MATYGRHYLLLPEKIVFIVYFYRQNYFRFALEVVVIVEAMVESDYSDIMLNNQTNEKLSITHKNRV